MATLPLTKERILDAAEEAILRFGIKKANVQDVARALDVSHPAIYRHFESKVALWDAVAKRWLDRTGASRDAILLAALPADEKLYRWLRELFDSKRQSATEDPEMFATYSALVSESGDILLQYLNEMISNIQRIIEEGNQTGVFDAPDSEETARAIFQAFTRFHHPLLAKMWKEPSIDRDFEGIWNLTKKGILAR